MGRFLIYAGPIAGVLSIFATMFKLTMWWLDRRTRRIIGKDAK
jgi:hypothetical protein